MEASSSPGAAKEASEKNENCKALSCEIVLDRLSLEAQPASPGRRSPMCHLGSPWHAWCCNQAPLRPSQRQQRLGVSSIDGSNIASFSSGACRSLRCGEEATSPPWPFVASVPTNPARGVRGHLRSSLPSQSWSLPVWRDLVESCWIAACNITPVYITPCDVVAARGSG